jgi:hypothetical protein
MGIKVKGAGDVAQTVGFMLIKHKALGSNSCPTKKKKKVQLGAGGSCL